MTAPFYLSLCQPNISPHSVKPITVFHRFTVHQNFTVQFLPLNTVHHFGNITILYTITGNSPRTRHHHFTTHSVNPPFHGHRTLIHSQPTISLLILAAHYHFTVRSVKPGPPFRCALNQPTISLRTPPTRHFAAQYQYAVIAHTCTVTYKSHT